MARDIDPAALLRPHPVHAGLWTATFPSGLRLVLQEDHRTPVAVANAWVRVGSNREPDALRGWSHGIEHMLFKGTARRGEEDFAREVADAGGHTNAGTGYETTNYHITVPAENLTVALDILGDALFHAAFTAEALDPEREVLVHENHMHDDQPFGYGLTWRLGLARALDVSPYRHSIGGRDENLRGCPREDIVAFWRSAYRPDNTTLVVVGDVDPAATAARVAATFPVAARPAAPASDPRVALVDSPPVEPAHASARLRREEGDVAKAYAKLIFPAPGEGDPRRHALRLLHRVLGDGRSCRLHRRVQEEAELVDDFLVVTETGPREGLMVVDLETDPGRVAAAVREVAAVLGELARDGCDERERERAVTRLRRAHAFGLETVQGQAANLGHHDALGDLEEAFALPARMAAVTTREVAELARTLFDPRQATVMLYLPTGAMAPDLPRDDADLAALLAAGFGGGAGAPPGTAAGPVAPATAPVRDRGAGSADTDFAVLPLDCGARLHVRRDPTVPVVAATFSVPGGAAGETGADAGRAALTRAVQLKGADGLDAATLHARLEDLGASLSDRGGRDHDGFLLAGLAERLEPALELAAACLLRPDFPAEEVDRERRLALAQLAAWQDDPFQAAVLAMREALYGDGHPYGRPQLGTPASLAGLDAAALRAHHARTWTAAGLQVVVSGDVCPDAVARRLDALLADLPAGAGDPPSWPGPVPPLDGVRRERLVRRKQQTVVLLGWPGPRDAHVHRVPLLLLGQLLNGQSGRLFGELRNRRSLCYNTGLATTRGRSQGMVLGYVLTAPESADAARDALRNELLRAAVRRAAPAEFARAQAKTLGNLVIAAQGNAAWVRRRADDLLLERPRPGLAPLLAEVAACGAEQVRAAAEAYLTPDACCEVVLGPEAGPAEADAR